MNQISKQSSLERLRPPAPTQVSIAEFCLSPTQFSFLVGFNNIEYSINKIKVNRKFKMNFRNSGSCLLALLLCYFMSHEHFVRGQNRCPSPGDVIHWTKTGREAERLDVFISYRRNTGGVYADLFAEFFHAAWDLLFFGMSKASTIRPGSFRRSSGTIFWRPRISC